MTKERKIKMTKKITSFLLALAMCITLLPTTFAATAMNITVGKTDVQYGASGASVNISLSGNPGIALIGFNVSYDDNALTLKSIRQGDIFTGALDCNVEKVPFMFSVYSTENKTANGKLVTLNFEFKPGYAAKTYDIKVSDVETYDINEKDVDYTVTDGYIKVAKKAITGVTFSDKSFDYDGKEKTIAVSGNLPAGATVAYTNEKHTDAGVYEVGATVKCSGYDDLALKAKMTINKKKISVTGLQAQNKTYDSTTDAKISGGALSGVVSGDDVKGKFPTKGTFAKADAGSNIAVSAADVTLSGTDKGNYTLTQQSGLEANITKAPIKIKADDAQMVMGEKVPALTYKVVSGTFYGSDKETGAPATAADGSRIGIFDITKGTLAVLANYELTFEKGTLSVVDKTIQNITVSEIGEKTYGDADFKVEINADPTSKLDTFTFESSNPNVAEISADGTVKIKAAGETDITVKQAGNDTYAAFTKTQKLVVKKIAITVDAKPASKKVGAADPKLEYTFTGKLAEGDSFTGDIARQPGETVGKYDILIGTLKINDNYDITFNKAIFEIFDKTPQNVTIAEIGEKTYGDADFKVEVTPDADSKLDIFTFESSNGDVAEVSADGTVKIKAAGEADITVKQAGNDDYAAFKGKTKLVVGQKAVTVLEINAEEKTAVLDGVLDADKAAVVLDFDKLNIEIVESVDETTSKATAKNFVLSGDKAANYNVTTESVEITIKTENVVKVSATAQNGEVSGAANYIKGSNVTVIATPASGYKFSGWYVDDELVSGDAEYTFKAESDIELEARFEADRRHSGGSLGGGGNSSASEYTLSFDTNDGTSVESIKAAYGEKVKEPAAPTKDGFVFDGWYKDSELTEKFDFTKGVTGSAIIYAKWREKTAEDNNTIVLTIGSTNATVWGESKTNDVAPIIRNERTMLPARFVAENLGAKVEWLADERKVVITRDDIEIVIVIDSDNATVNGEEITLDSPAFIENDRTYTPIRFISEQLGASVEWDDAAKTVTITK